MSNILTRVLIVFI